jgi:hypothetical protein
MFVMHKCNIFWHHVGREHGLLEYAPDIRKNDEEIIKNTLKAKEEWLLNQEIPNTFLKIDENTLIELPPKSSNENFLFIYLIDLGLQFELNDSKNWYSMVDIVEIHEIKKDVYCVSDLFIDIEVYTDGNYHVLDINEYEEAIKLNVINDEQISRSLSSFHYIIDELNRKEFPNDRLKGIINQFMKEGYRYSTKHS